MHWRVKGLVQKALSAAPGGMRVNDWLQKTVGTNRDFAGQLEGKVNDFTIFLSHTDKVGVRVQGLRLMEVGSGWFPTLPICYSLVEVGGCVTYDLHRHMNEDLTFRMLAGLEGFLEKIATAGGVSPSDVERNYARLRSAASTARLLELARIDYRAPADASASGLEAGSVDLVFSNAVFEHVPPLAIQNILHESYRVLKPGGLSIHSANCGDHYAYFDKSISPINYLTYTSEQWRLWDNDLLYQNRLRPEDLMGMARHAGFEIPLFYHWPNPAAMAALPNLTIAPEFRHHPPEQLCATSVDFVGRKTRRASALS